MALNRRTFLAAAGLAAGALTSLTACLQLPSSKNAAAPVAGVGGPAAVAAAPGVVPARPNPVATAHEGMSMTPVAGAPPAVSVAASAAAVAGLSKANEMDKHHQDGIKAFPAKTGIQGSQRLAFKMDGDVKVFELTASRIKWEVELGKFMDGMAYNAMIPGPEIRVTEGDKVRVVLKNGLVDQSTAIHFHGQRTPNKVDGVPFITQPPIKPGETFTYEFVAKPAGSHMYHSHHNAAEQVPGGLLGAFIVELKDQTKAVKYDIEYLMILNDGPFGFTLNGKGFPATQPLTAKIGQRVLIRYMNEGSMIHPMHLHGFPQTVIARDGYPLQPFQCDTLTISPGERWDVIVEPDEPGVWAFHCHVLSHAETANGMFGMVTALIVT